MAKKTALVTGACGFIGSSTVDYLLAKGYKVRATDLDVVPKTYFNKATEFLPADLVKIEEVWPLLKGIELLFHVAAINDYSCSLDALLKVNVEGTENLLKVARDSPQIKRIVVWSTEAFYDSKNRPDLIFSEEDPINPKRNNYTYSKFLQEQLSLDYARKYKLPVIVIRPAAVYGPWGFYGISLLIINALKGKLNFIPGRGDKSWATCHVLDVCRAAEFLTRIPEAVGQIYNIADDSSYTIKELFHFISEQIPGNKIHGHIPLFLVSFMAEVSELWAKIKGSRPKIEKDTIDYLLYPFLISNQKIKSLGFEFIYPDSKIGLKETIEWYKKNPVRNF